jgi:replicative superfamily II helicase
MELAMLQKLGAHIDSSGSFVPPEGSSKIIYIGPIRALVQERVQDWGERLGQLGCRCIELTGDNDATSSCLESADIICTTPEKFGKELDSLSKQEHCLFRPSNF